MRGEWLFLKGLATALSFVIVVYGLLYNAEKKVENSILSEGQVSIQGKKSKMKRWDLRAQGRQNRCIFQIHPMSVLLEPQRGSWAGVGDMMS